MKKPGLLLLLLITLIVAWPARAADEAPKAVPEYAMKAVYLYNFAQLTDWPALAGNEDVFRLCVYGQDEMIASLEGLRGRTVNKRPLRALRVSDLSEARQCHLLYVGDGDIVRGARILEALRGSPVLTVTDDPRVARSGVMLLIVPDERRLGFDVDLELAKRSQLKLSSKLLRLARRVSGE